MPKEGELEFQDRSNRLPCMRVGCTRDTYGGSRGLCVNHFSVASAWVKKGVCTWEQLEEAGKTRPKLTGQERGALRREAGLQRVWSTNLGRFIFVKK